MTMAVHSGTIASSRKAQDQYTFRYWRLYITRWSYNNVVGTSGDTRVAEFRLFTQSGVKWPTATMLNANDPAPFVASASSSVVSLPPYYAFNNEDTDVRRWISGTGDSQHWLQIDLGSSVQIKSVSISPDSAVSLGYFPVDLSIKGSNTGAFSGEEGVVYSATNLSSGAWANLTPKTFVF